MAHTVHGVQLCDILYFTAFASNFTPGHEAGDIRGCHPQKGIENEEKV